MRTVKITLLVLICTALLGACGLKGPLYLPEDDPVPGPDSSAEPEDDEDEKETENNGGTNTFSN